MGENYSKIEALKKDLQCEIEAVNPKRGDIIIVKPKSDEIAFPDSYRNWIIDVLHKLRPDVQIMVMIDNQIDISIKKEG